MSQRNKVVQEADGYWFARGSMAGKAREHRFGGIFSNTPGPWRTGQGQRFKHFSVTRIFNSGIHAEKKEFRKFRHAKKCLSQWVNP